MPSHVWPATEPSQSSMPAHGNPSPHDAATHVSRHASVLSAFMSSQSSPASTFPSPHIVGVPEELEELSDEPSVSSVVLESGVVVLGDDDELDVVGIIGLSVVEASDDDAASVVPSVASGPDALNCPPPMKDGSISRQPASPTSITIARARTNG